MRFTLQRIDSIYILKRIGKDIHTKDFADSIINVKIKYFSFFPPTSLTTIDHF